MSPAGEVRFSSVAIETEDVLAKQVAFSGDVLSASLGLSAHLWSHICPIEVKRSEKRCIVLVTDQYRNSDELREVLTLLAQRGYQLKSGPSANHFRCTPGMLLSVAKGSISADDLLKSRQLQANKRDSALWQTFNDVAAWAFSEKASDIHFNILIQQERSQIRFTIGGKYVAPERWALPTVMLSQMLGVAYQRSRGGADPTFIPTKEQQCNIFLSVPSGEGGSETRVMLRWASMATDDGPQVTMRLLQLDVMQQSMTLEGLGYLPSQISMLRRAQKSEGGAIVFAGVVGSGKSTTIATVMSEIPSTRKVMTIEDPREYIIPGSHANTISRSLDGAGPDNFKPKLATLKRSAFNDLLLGEIRDRETGLTFQDVVLSGQNLYSTTHARSALGIFDKLASPMVGIERDILATPGAVKLAVYQALLPVNCPKCRIDGRAMLNANPVQMSEYVARLSRLYGLEPEQIYFRNSEGCAHCRREGLPDLYGLKGRTVVAEMVEPDEQMLEYVKDGNGLALARYMQTLPRTGYRDPCMDNKTTLDCAVYKMSCGEIDPREIEPRFSAFETIEIRQKRSTDLELRKFYKEKVAA